MTYPPQQPGPYGPQDPYGQQPQWGYPVGPPPSPKKSRTGLITTLVIVAVLVIGGGGVAAFLLLRDDGGGGGNSGTPRATADSFAKELGTVLSTKPEDIDLEPLKPLMCAEDFKELDGELASDPPPPSSEKVTLKITEFKENSEGATFKVGPPGEDPLSLKVQKEKDNWVVCGVYDQDRQSSPEPGDGGGNQSIPNPIPTS